MTDQEINEAMARKLGVAECPNQPGLFFVNERLIQHDDEIVPVDEWGKPRDYCHSIEAAWQIVEHVNAISRFVVAWRGDHWWCQFIPQEINESYSSEADTAPMAICKAFLMMP